jgi:sensor domain DACNV-containing protein
MSAIMRALSASVAAVTPRGARLRAFPNHLAKVVAERWNRLVGGDYETPPYPPVHLLRELLESAYLTAGVQEEGRYPQFNIAAVPRSNFDEKRYLGEVWHFDSERRLSVDELRRLAPAVDFKKSAILAKWDAKHWYVAGLIDFGTSWSRARSGLQYHYRFPECLVIQVDRPGRLKVYQGRYLVAALSGGKLERHRGFELNLSVGRAAGYGLKKISKEIAPPKVEHPREYHNFLFSSLWNIYAAVANCISEAGHGGAVVIVPKLSRAFERELRIKYRQNSSILRSAYVAFMNARNAVIDFVIQMEDGDNSVEGEWALAELKLAECHSHLVEAIRFVARLSGCDGAIVMSDDLCLLGFGAEIRSELRINTRVREMTDELRRKFKLLDIEQFGQRHRSAIKLVSRQPLCTVVVVSQDGPVSVAWSEEKSTVNVKKSTHFVNIEMPFA